MNQSTDWLDDIYWRNIISGVSWVLFIPSIITLVGTLLNLRIIENWVLQVSIVVISIFIGAFVAAWSCKTLIGRLASAVICAFASASVYLLLSSLNQPASYTDTTSLMFLFFGFFILSLISSLLYGFNSAS